MTQRTLADLVGDSARPTGEPLPVLKRFNVVARFPDGDVARRAILDLERVGIDGSRLAYVPTAHPGTGVREPHPTGPEAATVDPTGVTGEAARGALQGAVAGAIVGAAAFVIGYLILSDGARAGGLLAAGIAGALLGGAAGGLMRAFSRLGASRSWAAAHEDTRTGPAIVGVHTDDGREARQAVGHCAGAFAVDVVDDRGQPVW